MDVIGKKIIASINIEIKTYEIDAAGHVNNIVYVKWLEDLRCKIFEQMLPIQKLILSDLFPVVVSTQINYKKQLKLNDDPIGIASVESIRHNIIILKYEFFLNGEVCSSAEQKCVLMNLKTGEMDKSKLKTFAAQNFSSE